MIRQSLRFRMMALFCAVAGVLLAGSDAGLYAIFARAVHAQVDRRLLETANPIIADLVADPTENDVDQLNLPNQYFEVLSAGGAMLQRSKNLHQASLAIVTSGLRPDVTTFQSVPNTSGETLRVGLVPFRIGNQTQFLAVGVSPRDADEALASARGVMMALFPLSLLLAAASSWWYTNRSLRPVAELTRRAAAMSESAQAATFQLSPLPVNGAGDEVDVLAVTFNRLFGRLNAVIRQLRQFVSDAAHELKTPLAVLHGETELTLSRDRTPVEYEQALRIIDGEVKTLSRIVEGLFTLSMADAGQLRINREAVYVEEVLEEACSMAAPMAQAKSIRIVRNLPRDVAYSGDPAFLRQLFLIFLDNAIKYSAGGRTLEVGLNADRGRIKIEFRDQGAGIAPEHMTRIFERFYRVPQAGWNDSQSGGLGLAIAQAIVHAHGGTIECSSQPGVGSTFTVILKAD